MMAGSFVIRQSETILARSCEARPVADAQPSVVIRG